MPLAFASVPHGLQEGEEGGGEGERERERERRVGHDRRERTADGTVAASNR